MVKEEGMKRLAIIGAGSWGSALSIALAPKFERVSLWAYETDLADRMESGRENDVFLPGFRLPDNIQVTADLAEALAGSDLVIGVMPSAHARTLYRRMASHVPAGCGVISATKGLEQDSLLRISDVIAECIPAHPVAVLSGPTFAREIAAGQPAAVVIASADLEFAGEVQKALVTRSLRFYTNSDTVGVELGAALKNVIALAAGVIQGLGLGSNTRAALITRGLREITRLAMAAGGRAETLAGLAGLGDLVLTCTGELSRNRQVGMRLGQGEKLPDILASMRMVAEGVETTRAALALAARYGIDLPITKQIGAILYEGQTPQDAIRELMDRSLKAE
jgi:glycerol-3-phosphate dehydrogenase (NAD(P)+)